MLFGPKAPASSEILDWIADSIDWIEEHRPDWADDLRLITPDGAFFRTAAGDTHATATHLAHEIMAHLKVTMPVTIEPLPELPDELRHQYGQTNEIAGQFMQDGADVLITYRPSLLRQPLTFVNTMAHEIMHLRLADVVHDLPGGIEAHELSTDLHCILAGYGLIQIEAAEDAGWSGYMTQGSRTAALAMFLNWQGIAPDLAYKHLSRRRAKALKQALAWFEKTGW